VDLVRPSCARGRGGALDQARAMGQRRPHLQGRSCLLVRPCLARVERWFQFLSKCVPAHENHNTTRGTLLLLKMCMKLVIYSSRTLGFDGRIFVVRTVNTTEGCRETQQWSFIGITDPGSVVLRVWLKLPTKAERRGKDKKMCSCRLGFPLTHLGHLLKHF
jgi:hypothetical protein